MHAENQPRQQLLPNLGVKVVQIIEEGRPFIDSWRWWWFSDWFFVPQVEDTQIIQEYVSVSWRSHPRNHKGVDLLSHSSSHTSNSKEVFIPRSATLWPWGRDLDSGLHTANHRKSRCAAAHQWPPGRPARQAGCWQSRIAMSRPGGSVAEGKAAESWSFHRKTLKTSFDIAKHFK